jgi:hypothetical protein
MKRKADVNDPFVAMGQIAQEAGDKRFLAQLAGVKSLFEKSDWRGVTIGCRMLYKIAHEGGYLERIEPVLRPFFDAAVERFEKSRAAMVRLHARLVAASRKLKQVERLAHLMRSAA